MSLDTLNINPPKKKIGEGYQVFIAVQDVGRFGQYKLIFPDTQKVRKINLEAWTAYRANHKNTLTCKFSQIWDKKKVRATYKAGFHIWKKEQDAEEHFGWMQIMFAGKGITLVIRKVSYTGAFAEGLIENKLLIVARSIMIHEEIPEFLGEADYDEDDDY